jgi:hypothetical protein
MSFDQISSSSAIYKSAKIAAIIPSPLPSPTSTMFKLFLLALLSALAVLVSATNEERQRKSLFVVSLQKLLIPDQIVSVERHHLCR